MAQANKHLLLDRDFYERPEIARIEDLEEGQQYIIFYLKLLIKAEAPTLPCDKDQLAAMTGTEPDFAANAINAFYRAGLISLVDPPEEFTPPTLQEVVAYARELNSPADPRRFYEFYNASDFKFKGQVIDWRQKFRDWTATERPRKRVGSRQLTAAEYNRKPPVVVDVDKLKRMEDRI